MSKKLIVTMLIVGILLAGIGGGVYMAKQKEEKAEAAERAEKVFWQNQKPRVELYFRYNFDGVETFHYTGTDRSPMGTSISGYINENPDYRFTAHAPGYESEFNSLVSYSDEFDKNHGKSEERKTVDEILKEENSDQQ